MSVYALPHTATAKEIKCYAIGGGRVVWTYKKKKRAANLAPQRMNWSGGKSR